MQFSFGLDYAIKVNFRWRVKMEVVIVKAHSLAWKKTIGIEIKMQMLFLHQLTIGVIYLWKKLKSPTSYKILQLNIYY